MFYQRKYCNFDFILKILKFLLIFYKYFLNKNELGREKNLRSGEFYVSLRFCVMNIFIYKSENRSDMIY